MIDIWQVVIGASVGLLTGFISGLIGGGGGLLLVPVLTMLGLPVNSAIATMRFGAIGLTGGSFAKFSKAGKIEKGILPLLLLISAVGSFIGARLLVEINEELLEKIIGLVLLGSAPLLLSKKIGQEKIERHANQRIVGYILFFFVSVYSGFIGSPAGIFGVYVLITLFGLTYIRANATGNITFAMSLLFSVAIYVQSGLIAWQFAIPLFFTMMIGGYAGSHVALRQGNQFVRVGVAILVAVSSSKFLFF